MICQTYPIGSSNGSRRQFRDDLEAIFPELPPSIIADAELAFGEVYNNCLHMEDSELIVTTALIGGQLRLTFLAQSHVTCLTEIRRAIERSKERVGAPDEGTKVDGRGLVLLAGLGDRDLYLVNDQGGIEVYLPLVTTGAVEHWAVQAT